MKSLSMIISDFIKYLNYISHVQCICVFGGARCSSVVRAFAHGPMGRRIDSSWGRPIELFLIPASVPRLV